MCRIALGIAVVLTTAIGGFVRSAGDSVEGIVIDVSGRGVPGATVRIQATTLASTTRTDGRFRLDPADPQPSFRVTAWKEGFYVAGMEARSGANDLRIVIERHPVTDRSDYTWVPPEINRADVDERRIRAALDEAARVSLRDAFLPLAEKLTLGCRDCHGGALYREWASSAHAAGARNPIFLGMYYGTDGSGNRGPPPRKVITRDYGALPLKPDPRAPYYGPGYKLDFPVTAGNCAACHIPGAALDDPYGIDPASVRGVDARGTHCDFCHKVGGVQLAPDTGRPRAEMPGVLSLRVIRPGPERQLFFGPYDDVDTGPDTFLPLMKRSEICAPCHDASFWGVPIYESFAEWQASPYATRGEHCQYCHMRADGRTTNFAFGRGGVERDPASIPSHAMTGAADADLLSEAVALTVDATNEDGKLRLTVKITNDGAGHHVPTDSPLRQMILRVRATDERGGPLELLEGSTLPPWVGTRDGVPGHYGGQPGKVFAKVLRETWTGVEPTGAYWNPTQVVEDSRIAAMATDSSTYTFSASGARDHVQVLLLFRRAFIELAERKGWDRPDIVMARRDLVIDAAGRER